MGVDIDLIRLQAYRTNHDVVVTVSRIYPIADVEEFTVAPVRANARRAREDLPDLPWDEESLRRLHEVATNPTVLAAMTLCSESPGSIISIRDLEAKARRTPHQLRADLAGLTLMVKRRFGRSNWLFRLNWAAGGEQIAYYLMDHTTAATWRTITDGDSAEEPTKPT